MNNITYKFFFFALLLAAGSLPVRAEERNITPPHFGQEILFLRLTEDLDFLKEAVSDGNENEELTLPAEIKSALGTEKEWRKTTCVVDAAEGDHVDAVTLCTGVPQLGLVVLNNDKDKQEYKLSEHPGWFITSIPEKVSPFSELGATDLFAVILNQTLEQFIQGEIENIIREHLIKFSKAGSFTPGQIDIIVHGNLRLILERSLIAAKLKEINITNHVKQIIKIPKLKLTAMLYDFAFGDNIPRIDLFGQLVNEYKQARGVPYGRSRLINKIGKLVSTSTLDELKIFCRIGLDARNEGLDSYFANILAQSPFEEFGPDMIRLIESHEPGVAFNAAQGLNQIGLLPDSSIPSYEDYNKKTSTFIEEWRGILAGLRSP